MTTGGDIQLGRSFIAASWDMTTKSLAFTDCPEINPLNAELNPIRHLLALLGARHIVHVSRIRVNIILSLFGCS